MSELPPSKVIELLDVETKIEKRASWEAFEFTLLGDGDVEVMNGSHDEPDKHTCTVHIEGGIPAHCTCPAWKYQGNSCKHMVAVAIREPILEAVSAKPTLKSDGGVVVEEVEGDYPNERPDGCNCSPLFEDLPCWSCYRDGFNKPNPNADMNNK